MTLPLGITDVAYSGAAETFTATFDGVIEFDLWGGGGGGGSYGTGGASPTRPNRGGGNGGYAKGMFPIAVGDVIKIEVGQGGRKPTGSSPAAGVGGLGGWPDGGRGGSTSVTTSSISLGGGGGSTRLYKNNVLLAVAGAGGGGTGYYYGGSGGGGLGSASGNLAAQAGEDGVGVGGTQTSASGGATALKGADADGLTTPAGTAGAGGGGGWFGGGTGRGNGAHSAGAGGSSYTNTAQLYNFEQRIALYVAGVVSDAPPLSAQIPAGVAKGGLGATTVAAIQNGGDGLARLTVKRADLTLAKSDGALALTPLGRDHTITISERGALEMRLWGAGGGGGSYGASTSTTRRGGAGAVVSGEIKVAAGDVITVKVGVNGQRGAHDVGVVSGGRAAYPDGGGSNRSGANTAIMFGAGGGSTQVFKNGVLVAVAAAGGGGTGFYSGGAGGALTGFVGPEAVAANGTGGTQSAGGSLGGGYLQGGTCGTSTTDTANGGSGGGGGYYGGGAHRGAAGAHGAGGGGSSYLHPTLIIANTGVMTAGNNTTGLQTDKTGAPAGVSDGGVFTVRYDTPTHGGAGHARLLLKESDAEGAPIDPIVVSSPDGTAFNNGTDLRLPYLATKTAYEIKVGETGTLITRLWGGGGGGGFNTFGAPTQGAGASGGYVFATVQVNTGDVVKLEVGGGGKGGGVGVGLGGWPDGGNGAAPGNSGAIYYNGAGGGGSTRLYVNNVLQLVAGAGGGGWGPSNDRPQNVYAGGGGGLTGGSGSNNASTLAPGGSQTAGGTNTTAGAGNGGALQGGSAYPAPNPSGGGGGGGYYGGASGNVNNSITAGGGGGGGSSWSGGGRVTSVLHEQGASAAGAPGGVVDPNYVAGVAVGGLTAATNPSQDGGHGYAMLSLATGLPANKVASFDVSIPVTPPAGSGGVPLAINGALKTLVVNPTLGTATVPVSRTVGLPGPIVMTGFDATTVTANDITNTFIPPIYLGAAPTGGAISSALIVQNDPRTILLEAPIIGGVEGAVNASAPIKTISISDRPQAAIYGNAAGDLVVIALTAPDGLASIGADNFVVMGPPILLNPVGGVAVSIATPSGPVDARPYTYLSPPQGKGTGGTYGALGDLGKDIDVITVDGVGDSGPAYDGQPFPPVLILAPAGAGAGAARATATNQGGIGSDSYFRLISVTAPSVRDQGKLTVEGGQNIEGQGFPAPIDITTGDATVDLAAFALIPLPDPVFVSFSGLAIFGYEVRTTLLPVIDLDQVHGYANDSKVGKLHLKRTRVEGRAPATLLSREMVVNEADGALYHFDVNGDRTSTEFAKIVATPLTVGGHRQVLNGLGQWVEAHPTYGAPILLRRPAGRRIISDRPLKPATSQPAINRSLYHPFKSFQTLDITALSVEVSTPAAGVASMAIYRWNPVTRVLGDMLCFANVNTDVAGVRSASVSAKLVPGHYAVGFRSTGQAVFSTYEATAMLDASLNPIGDPSAAGVMGTAPSLTETASLAFVSAEVAQ